MGSTCTSCGAPNLPEGEFVCKTCLNQERRTQPGKIDSFRGKYYFLSNFYPAEVTYRGITYKNNEAAFQSMKCPSEARKFANLSASEAKSLGRRIIESNHILTRFLTTSNIPFYCLSVTVGVFLLFDLFGYCCLHDNPFRNILYE